MRRVSENLKQKVTQPIEVSKFLKLNKGFIRPGVNKKEAEKSDVSTVKDNTDFGYDRLIKTKPPHLKLPPSIIQTEMDRANKWTMFSRPLQAIKPPIVNVISDDGPDEPSETLRNSKPIQFRAIGSRNSSPKLSMIKKISIPKIEVRSISKENKSNHSNKNQFTREERLQAVKQMFNRQVIRSVPCLLVHPA